MPETVGLQRCRGSFAHIARLEGSLETSRERGRDTAWSGHANQAQVLRLKPECPAAHFHAVGLDEHLCHTREQDSAEHFKLPPGRGDPVQVVMWIAESRIGYPHHNLYWITSAGWELEVLGGILLSRVAQMFVEAYGVKMRGGTLRFQAQYLRLIRVPAPGSVPPALAARLKRAFQTRDVSEATAAALETYGLRHLPD